MYQSEIEVAIELESVQDAEGGIIGDQARQLLKLMEDFIDQQWTKHSKTLSSHEVDTKKRKLTVDECV